MNFVPYDINRLNTTGYKKTVNLEKLQEFIDSGLLCAKVENWKHKNANIAAASFRRSAKLFKLNIAVLARKGEVYLINMNLI